MEGTFRKERTKKSEVFWDIKHEYEYDSPNKDMIRMYTNKYMKCTKRKFGMLVGGFNIDYNSQIGWSFQVVVHFMKHCAELRWPTILAHRIS